MADDVTFDWWQGSNTPDMGAISPDYDEMLKSVKKDYYRDFATGFQRQQFATLDDYQRWARSLPNSYKQIDGYIRQLALEYMPRKLRDEYEQQQALKKSEDAFKRTIDMHGQLASRIQDAVDAGDLPKGVFFDPKTNGLNYKAPKTTDPSKARNQLISELGKFRQLKEKADLEGSEEESVVYSSEIERILGELKGQPTATGAGQQGMTQEVQLDQLVSYVDQLQDGDPDKEALTWAIQNAEDPRAGQIIKVALGAM